MFALTPEGSDERLEMESFVNWGVLPHIGILRSLYRSYSKELVQKLC